VPTLPEPTDKPSFQQQQLAFTAHIRDPETQPVPDGIPPRRMAVYRELLFNNLDDQLANNFPVLRRITRDEDWAAMVRDFMIVHRCDTPLFTEIGLEFLDYLQHERAPRPTDWPFMLELAHYEYVELAVAISTADEGLADFDPNGDLVAGQPLVAPTAWPLSYAWPVHQVGPDYLPDAAPDEPTHLVVYRDRADEVHFLQINAVTRRLLELLADNTAITGLDALTTLAVELGHADPDTVVESGRALLQDLRGRNVILGTRT
jgi:hypothetical protein